MHILSAKFTEVYLCDNLPPLLSLFSHAYKLLYNISTETSILMYFPFT